MNAAEHLERYLGHMEGGWSSESCPGIQVCRFRDQPFPGIVTLATLGLSNTILTMKDRAVCQELLLTVQDAQPLEELGKLLLHVADLMLRNQRALLRGEIFHLSGEIAANSAAKALYAAIPVVFPDGLATLTDSVPPTVVVWLVPLLPAEADFVDSAGWSEFEDRLEAADPDLFDLCRNSVV